MKHHWKQLAEILGCPYRQRFSTNGYGDYRIDNKGLYSYEDKSYYEGYLGFSYLCEFLNGEISIQK